MKFYASHICLVFGGWEAIHIFIQKFIGSYINRNTMKIKVEGKKARAK
jgi:hypothetical protein